jgi:excisionase family DNA binding protein
MEPLRREHDEPVVGQILYPIPMGARTLGISDRMLWGFIAKGEIKTRKCGSRVLIHRSELEKFARADHDSPETNAATEVRRTS